MGMEIGQVVGISAIGGQQQQAASRVISFAQREGQSVAAGQERPGGGPFFGRDESKPLRVGFGDGTVSVPGVTVRTIGRNLDGARRIVPTQEEVQAQVQEHVAALRAQQKAQDSVRVQTQPLNLTQPEVEGRRAARAYVNQVNEAAGTAQARLQGEQPTRTGANLSILIGDETTNLMRQTGPTVLDVRA